MDTARQSSAPPSVPTAEGAYEPPTVDMVMTAADLEREALYGGLGAYGPG